MSGVRITINTAELQEAIAGLAAVMRAPERVMGTIGEALITSTQERQRRGIAPDGSAWPALNPGYAAEKAGSQMLRESGRLMGSLSHRASGNTVVVGTNVIYAGIHQFGGTILPKSKRALSFIIGDRRVIARKVTVPARPFLGISAEDREEIRDIFILAARRAMSGGR